MWEKFQELEPKSKVGYSDSGGSSIRTGRSIYGSPSPSVVAQ